MRLPTDKQINRILDLLQSRGLDIAAIDIRVDGISISPKSDSGSACAAPVSIQLTAFVAAIERAGLLRRLVCAQMKQQPNATSVYIQQKRKPKLIMLPSGLM